MGEDADRLLGQANVADLLVERDRADEMVLALVPAGAAGLVVTLVREDERTDAPVTEARA